MTSATITLPDGRTARLTGPSREAIMAEAQKLVGPSPLVPQLQHNRGIDPNTGQFDKTLATMDDLLSKPVPQPRPTTLADRIKNIPLEQSLPIMGATLGSIAFPPLAAGTAESALPALAGLLSRGAQRFAPPVIASAIGGGAPAGALEAERPGSTPQSIAREAATTGATMGAAELAGLGLTTAAAKLAAPRLGFLDPLKGVRAKVGEFVGTIPGHVRNAARRVEELLPESAQSVTQAAAETTANATKILRVLVNESTKTKTAKQAAQQLGNAKATATAVANALGVKRAKEFGYVEGKNAGEFLRRVFLSGEGDVLKTVQKRLGKERFGDFQARHLAQLIARASSKGRDGVARLDGQKLAALWEALPQASKDIFSPGTQRAVQSLATFGSTLSRVGRFAASPIGGEMVEAAVTPLAFAVGGPMLGIPLMAAKALLRPSPLVKYLTRDKLPSDIAQMIGAQAVRNPIRAGLQEQPQ